MFCNCSWLCAEEDGRFGVIAANYQMFPLLNGYDVLYFDLEIYFSVWELAMKTC